jgi:hypothetical protein
VLIRAQAAAERCHDGGEEWWWFELGTRAKEGVRELKMEGKTAGEGRACSSPIIETEGASGRGGWGGNG